MFVERFFTKSQDASSPSVSDSCSQAEYESKWVYFDDRKNSASIILPGRCSTSDRYNFGVVYIVWSEKSSLFVTSSHTGKIHADIVHWQHSQLIVSDQIDWLSGCSID
jgi:hypothetical protein